jgi:hypothetical protein
MKWSEYVRIHEGFIRSPAFLKKFIAEERMIDGWLEGSEEPTDYKKNWYVKFISEYDTTN